MLVTGYYGPTNNKWAYFMIYNLSSRSYKSMCNCLLGHNCAMIVPHAAATFGTFCLGPSHAAACS